MLQGLVDRRSGAGGPIDGRLGRVDDPAAYVVPASVAACGVFDDGAVITISSPKDARSALVGGGADSGGGGWHGCC